MSNSRGGHDLFWPAESLSPTAGAGQAGLNAFAESDTFLLRDRGEKRDHRIREDPTGIEVRLGETAITDAGPNQSVEMSVGFEDAYAETNVEVALPYSLNFFSSRGSRGERKIPAARPNARVCELH
jgi:hypothetical protein